jgi:hypothetical protein
MRNTLSTDSNINAAKERIRQMILRKRLLTLHLIVMIPLELTMPLIDQNHIQRVSNLILIMT